MKVKLVLVMLLGLFAIKGMGQSKVTEIQTKKGTRYLTTEIDYPVTGTYKFQGAEPIVELSGNGTGIYQLHEEPKRPMKWGLECSKDGELKFKKGYDNAAYTLWYQYTDGAEKEQEWVAVEFSIHFNKMKMYIQGERMREFGVVSEVKN